MPHFFALCLEVLRVVRIGMRPDRELFDNVQTISLEPHDFFRIICKKSDMPNPKVDQNLGSGPIFPKIHRETEFLVGFNGVQALFLEFVGPDFGSQSNSAPFLAHVDQYTRTGFVDVLKCGV